MALIPGTRLGPYEVVSLLGEGGMGQVYRAKDTRLKRDVALKILPDVFAADPDRVARFQREAELLATLNHPNIASIYGLEQADVARGLVLELVEGPTLAERIARGPLLIGEVLAIAKQIAEALEAAHEHGIIHRDLKPANIKVREDGAVKVLDFGLAKAVEPIGGESPTATQSPTVTAPAMTQAAIVLGTIAYVSPEQASGKAVDARSDIFSFGTVLYEMASGRRAFTGDSSLAILASILRDEPPLLESHPEVVQIVKRCLSKSPADRFQTMTSVKASLAAVELVDKAPAIAVLPFANLSDDKAQEYFSDGLAEEIINALAQIPGLRVTARTSAFAFRGKEQDITKIAEALRVSAILEGSVRKSGNRIRVTAQLIDATNGYHLWSQRYDREITDVFVMQDEIAAAIASALRLKLGVTSVDRRTHQPNLRAYEAFLKGRHLLFENTATSIALAKDAFEQAIALDPEYSAAHAELATWHFVQAATGLRLPTETLPSARTHALKALALTPAEPRALTVLGAIAALYEHDWGTAGERFRLALTAPWVPPEVYFRFAIFYLVPLGRFWEALDQIGHAVEQDPLNVLFRGMFALMLNTKSPDRAVVEAQRAIEIDDRHWLPHYAMSLSHLRLGQLPKARQVAERSAAAAPWFPLPRGLLAGLLRRLGQDDDAEAMLSKLASSPSGMFIYHIVSSEIDAAADSFATAIGQGEVQPLMWLGAADFLGPLRSSSRWPALLKLANLPPETVGS